MAVVTLAAPEIATAQVYGNPQDSQQVPPRHRKEIGVGLVMAARVTVRSGALNIPLNVAVASSKPGTRVSIMTGFNIRRYGRMR